MNENRQELYSRFLEAYNLCACHVVNSISELLLFVTEPWKAKEGKEKEMKCLREIWGDLDTLELGYTDDVSYARGMAAIRRKLLLVNA